MSKVKITDELKKDLKEYSKNYCIGLAKGCGEEMTKEAIIAINMFYEDYDPVRYKRHYYNFLENSFKRYYQNAHNSIIRGGIELSSEKMNNIYNEGEPEITNIVFNLVYSGQHGNAQKFGRFIPPMVPSPLEILLNKRDYIVDNIYKYQRYGESNVKKESYATLS